MASVHIPDDTFQQLVARARALNISVEELVKPALEQLAENGGWVPAPSSPAPTREERRRAFEEWTKQIESRAGRYPPGHVLDDSRESIYREREDRQV
jgi:hypothetical protein